MSQLPRLHAVSRYVWLTALQPIARCPFVPVTGQPQRRTFAQDSKKTAADASRKAPLFPTFQSPKSAPAAFSPQPSPQPAATAPTLVPPVNVTDSATTSNGLTKAETPIWELDFMTRLTRTEEDRDLLRRVLRRMAQLLVFSLIFNIAFAYGWFDELSQLVSPSSPFASAPAQPLPVVTAEDAEDLALLERIVADTAKGFEERYQAARPKTRFFDQQPVQFKTKEMISSAGEPFPRLAKDKTSRTN